jgi:hypothetical protein
MTTKETKQAFDARFLQEMTESAEGLRKDDALDETTKRLIPNAATVAAMKSVRCSKLVTAGSLDFQRPASTNHAILKRSSLRLFPGKQRRRAASASEGFPLGKMHRRCKPVVLCVRPSGKAPAKVLIGVFTSIKRSAGRECD